MPDRPPPTTTTGPREGDGDHDNDGDVVVVAIGSRNPAKTLGTRNAFSRFFRRVEVREVDVSSQVRAQPMNLQETLAGARARAVIALRSLEGVEGRIDFGVGVEAGIMALRVAGAATTITAAAAAAVVPGVDVGEEMGQEEEKGEEEEEGESLNLQLAAITDSTGRIHYGCSSGFPLPSQLVSRMRKDGRELDAYAHELTGAPKIREEEGIIYHLSKGNLSRVEMTEQCVSMALLPWVNREAYDLRRLDEKKELTQMRPPESVVGYFVRMQQQPNPTVAVETNGRGFIGFIVDLPGGYVRGKTEAEAVSKAGLEVSRYLAWIGLGRGPGGGGGGGGGASRGGGGGGGGGMSRSFVVQRQTTTASVDQGDTMMLLDADRPKMRPEEFHALSDLVLYSGETFESVYRGAKLKGWTDESRLLPTFYGQRPCTIEQVYSHVRKMQAHYLSRLGVPLQDGDFMMMRRLAVNSLRNEFEHGARGGDGGGNRAPVTLEGEMWTLRKVLRRFVWHDRIHAKAILRIMRRQEQLGLIGAAVGEAVVDPFHFSSLA